MAEAAERDEPSGRLLDPGREAGARGMIVAEHCCKAVRRTESGLQAHPPNFYIKPFVISSYQFMFSSASPDCDQNVSKVFSKPSPFSMIRRTRSRNSFVNGA